jgi:hypothetical protein
MAVMYGLERAAAGARDRPNRCKVPFLFASSMFKSAMERLAVLVHKPGTSAWRAQAALAIARRDAMARAAPRCCK